MIPFWKAAPQCNRKQSCVKDVSCSDLFKCCPHPPSPSPFPSSQHLLSPSPYSQHLPSLSPSSQHLPAPSPSPSFQHLLSWLHIESVHHTKLLNSFFHLISGVHWKLRWHLYREEFTQEWLQSQIRSILSCNILWLAMFKGWNICA